MTFVPYQLASNDSNKWGWAPEEAFGYGTNDSEGTQWDANAAGDTFYHLPILPDESSFAIVRDQYEWSDHRSNSVDVKHSHARAKKPISITFSGKLLDLTWLHQLCDHCDTAGSDPYTHDTQQSDSRDNPPPSMVLWRKIWNDKNGGADESEYWLYFGCIVKSATITGVASDGTINAQFTVLCARARKNGVALTSEPTIPAKSAFIMQMLSVEAFDKGAVDYNYANVEQFVWSYQTDKRFLHSNSYYPVRSKLPDKVEHYIDLTISPMETDTYDDTQDLPNASNDRNMQIRLTRSTNDYIDFNFVDCQLRLMGESWNGGVLNQVIRAMYSGSDAGSPNYTITEKNSYDDTRYADGVYT